MFKKLFLPGLLILLGFVLFTNPTLKEIAAGIAILLFGMIMLEDGFNSFVAGPLQKLLQRATNKLYKSLGLGFLITAVLQSSSLISVIAISFISAGLIGLNAGIGIIFGANIGTTATAWLVSVFGLKVDIASLAMPMLAFGIILVLQKSKKVKGIGHVLAGLGFFFLGIYFMKDGFDTYKETINLADYAMPGITGLIVYTAIGIAITLILQSSSATMALTLTALAVGQITYTNSLAIAIGANIGTTITAIIGSLSANIAGKRLAGAHFVFNIVTGLIALIFIGYLRQFVDFISINFGVAEDNFTFKLSIFHTVFNLIGVAVMVPMINPLVKVLHKVFKEKLEEDLIDYPRFLNQSSMAYPQTAIRALLNETKRLFEESTLKIVAHGLNLHRTDLKSEEKIKKVVEKSREEIDVDIEEMYVQKVKTIYSKIIEYATISQSQFALTPEMTKEFARIKLANRNIVEAIKALGGIRQNMNEYLVSPNEHIQKEYDRLRQKVAKVLRELFQLRTAKDPKKHLDKMEKLKGKAEKSDVLLDGTLDELIRERKITSTMATSLANDSINVALISKKLIDAAELIYIKSDTLLEIIEEKISFK
ncbi:MAG: Na/Pi symporter [Saprospiraceae bacterium]|nr:Na/Pi symporter [Saprospiraceae bacterium]